MCQCLSDEQVRYYAFRRFKQGPWHQMPHMLGFLHLKQYVHGIYVEVFRWWCGYTWGIAINGKAKRSQYRSFENALSGAFDALVRAYERTNGEPYPKFDEVRILEADGALCLGCGAEDYWGFHRECSDVRVLEHPEPAVPSRKREPAPTAQPSNEAPTGPERAA
jgi:hypothetical protein